ncbi:unnamed protein product [Cylindrotheca closterium]|uniref:Uncharacterized protein n=1 Tax=Cylindrotheca closterium TaxID=2856 RepID=A0AAD2CS12_9STRA|nr:unnamed protein product [Cylindrotheca closterium]
MTETFFEINLHNQACDETTITFSLHDEYSAPHRPGSQDPFANRRGGASGKLESIADAVPNAIGGLSTKEQNQDDIISEASPAGPDYRLGPSHIGELASRHQGATIDDFSIGMEGGMRYLRPSKTAKEKFDQEQKRLNDELDRQLREKCSENGWMDPEVAKICSKIANQKFDKKQRHLWEKIDQLLQEKGLMDLDVARRYKKIARHLYNKGSFEEALELYEQSSTIEKSVFQRDDHPEMASTYHSIGSVLQNQGKYEDAMEQFQRALDIKSKVHGPDHSSTASTYDSIGSLLKDQGKYEEAMEQHQRALEIKLRALGPDHLKTSRTYHSIGNILFNQGKYEEAMEQYERTLEIVWKVHGPDHSSTATIYHNIGNVLHKQRKNEEAMKQYQRALEINLKAFGPNHSSTAKTYHCIGHVLYIQGKYGEAWDTKVRLRSHGRRLGFDIPELQWDINTLETS